MPKRNDINSVLIIGAGPIVIGQACEFDYSGAQACKALREEGIRVVLVNSNPATIMTDPSMADATYIEPVHWQTVAKIIEKERPDALLPTMGGQTALNCALDLSKHGILSKYNVEMIGANASAIDKAEDRERFDIAMRKIGLTTPNSGVAHSLEEANQIADRFGFPCIIRPSFTMGGSGGGIAYNREEFGIICRRGLDLSPTDELLIDESLIGWKEFEMEVMRDCNDNCIIVCAIENFDPMGIHTGDSITVAPAQTLTDKEYQLMRDASVRILREIGIETGGSNVQFAVNPVKGDLVVIEMNPRVSRSSALASKATGFPIAKIAAKLSIGYTLNELRNEITGGRTPASFEPTIDYVVTKVPRFAFEKFNQASAVLTTQMKSVGEVMAIGRTFQESLQKALRGLELGFSGLDPLFKAHENDLSYLKNQLSEATPERIWYIGDAFRVGMTCDDVHEMTNIDHWFLSQIEDLISEERSLQATSVLSKSTIFRLKRKGFSDLRLAELTGKTEKSIRKFRWDKQLFPVYKRVDTCAAEFATDTAYMYSTYEEECESHATENKKILILGGGPNRIGQGIEFDYCCVHASLALREEGFETIMVNCNPETVSTDFDISNRLYFEPVTLEDVLEIIRVENPSGVIVQFGGQTPLRLARSLENEGVKIIGTSPDAIDRAEDRERFQNMIKKLALLQPNNATARSIDEAMNLAQMIGYPLVVRPSYVLGGRAMEIVYKNEELLRYMETAVSVGNDAPVLLDLFLPDAIEIDIDVVSDGNNIVLGAIMQHIEQAGIHSGDSACSLPPHSLSANLQDKMRDMCVKMARELGVVGLMNVQLAIQDGEIYVIEVNPRASRTIPFVSKCIGISLAQIAAKCMAGTSLKSLSFTKEIEPVLYGVKEAVFPFNKFPGIDPILGPEMKSTGEVMGIGASFAEAYGKAQLGSGEILPSSGNVFISVRDRDKQLVPAMAEDLEKLGFCLFATRGTAEVIKSHGISVSIVNKVQEGRPHIVDMIKSDQIDLIINTTEGRKAISDSSTIRSKAEQHQIYYTTTMAGGRAVCETLKFSKNLKDITVRSLQSVHKEVEL